MAKGLAYPCVCSRRDVESAQSAPHAGEQLHYPGTCRGRFASWREAYTYLHSPTPPLPHSSTSRSPCWRFRVSDGLACVVDDLDMGITEVVRGDDLLPATPAQILVARALGNNAPSYCHLPLVVGPDGRRLAKRHGDTRVASFREAGWSAERVIGLLAASCGWAEKGEELSLAALLPRFDLAAIPKTPFVYGWRS